MPIFAKLVFGEQPFIKKFCTEVHENPADGLVANTTYVADGRTYIYTSQVKYECHYADFRETRVW